jgi:hypothetical protein
MGEDGGWGLNAGGCGGRLRDSWVNLEIKVSQISLRRVA